MKAMLRVLMVTLFLPEGFSFFIGDFRLSPVRVMLILLTIAATVRFFQQRASGAFVIVPSDLTAIAAGIWMILSTAVTIDASSAVKGGAAAALEFTGAYFAFRLLLRSPDTSVELIRFSCKVVIFVVGLASLDTLYDTLFTYETVKRLTGYAKPIVDEMLASGAESVFRNGHIRAQGPLEHSIMFGAACAWFATLAVCTFPARLFGKGIAGVTLFGLLISQARAPLVAYIAGLGLTISYYSTKWFTARWRVLGSLVAVYFIAIFSYSRSPIATLMRFSGIDPSAAWYREIIWATATPLVLGSPFFGTGGDWDWQGSDALVGSSVDALWLALPLSYGIPGTVFMFLTMVGAFWRGPVDNCPFLTREEKRLSVALGLVVATTVFLGFTVHIYGTCGIFLAIFPGMRASLAEAAIVRGRAARHQFARYYAAVAAGAERRA